MTNPRDAELKAKRTATIKEKFWPSVATPEGARQTARQGMWAAYIGGGLTVAAIAVAFMSKDVQEFLKEILSLGTEDHDSLAVILLLAFLEGLIFLGLGFAISKMSRAAAVIALVLFLVDKIMLPPGNPAGIIIALGFIWCYALGIRGTFAWHRLQQKA